MRYRKNITFCADGGKRLPAQRFVSQPHTAWIGQGTAFSTPEAKRRCTLLVVWYVEQEELWIIPTDLEPDKVGPIGKRSVSGPNWASRPSRVWAGSGTRPGAPTQPASLDTGWCSR